MAAAWTTRHQACASRIADTFSIPASTAAEFVRQHARAFSQLFSAAVGTSAHLLVYHQPELTLTDSEWLPSGDKPRLYATQGDQEPLRGAGMYFLRTAGAIEVDKAEGGLVIGELTVDPLRHLQSHLAHVFTPSGTAAAAASSSDDPRTALHEDMTCTSEYLAEVRTALESGLQLAAVDSSKYNVEELLRFTATRNRSKRSSMDVDTVLQLQGTLETWCNQVDAFVHEMDAHVVEHARGPRGVLEWWHDRLQRLTSIVEQLKRRDVRAAVFALTAVTKGPPERIPAPLFTLLRRWKDVDIHVTEAANEAKDNSKYLATLEKFVEPMYTGSPAHIMDALPALMNSIKMIHTIARYFHTPERMTDLFVKITHQMISACHRFIVSSPDAVDGDNLWRRDPDVLLPRLEACLKLNEMYQEAYRLTKERLAVTPASNQFVFNETAIFSRFDAFCRRVIKLIDLFSTRQQYQALKAHQIEGMEPLIGEFEGLVGALQARRYNLLAFTVPDFDRAYVEFNCAVDALEIKLQHYITGVFNAVASVESSLHLLEKFQAVLRRESVSSELESKAGAIFAAFARELDTVQALYEEQKQNPPRPRNMPPVAGNIAWSRNLLARLERPMRVFETRHAHVFSTREGRALVKQYNRIARTLVAFECLWYNAWLESLPAATAGLQATLIIRHPEDKQLYVNFDAEILQCIRESKCLVRMGLHVPEAARILVLQEARFKSYHGELSACLREYTRVTSRVLPVTASLLRPALAELDYRMRPGMMTLTWTSMSIDAYRSHVMAGLARVDQLVSNVNDIVENRVEDNLRSIARTLLVDIPTDHSCTLDEFTAAQASHTRASVEMLITRNIAVEGAVRDVLDRVVSYAVDGHLPQVAAIDCVKLQQHYNHFTYTAMLYCAKNSLNALKRRVAVRGSSAFLFTERPFFELEVILGGPSVTVSPSLDDVQMVIKRVALNVLSTFRNVHDWREATLDQLGTYAQSRRQAAPTLAGVTAGGNGGDDESVTASEASLSLNHDSSGTFFARIARDMEFVRVALLLTGSLQSAREEVTSFLAEFEPFAWLWRQDGDAEYREFAASSPSLEDYEAVLVKLMATEDALSRVHVVRNVGALTLQTSSIKTHLRSVLQARNTMYCDALHRTAVTSLAALHDSFKSTLGKLSRSPDGLDSMKFLMDTLKAVRERQTGIELEFAPIADMHVLLEVHMPEGYMSKSESDMRAMLRPQWAKVVERAEEVQASITALQHGFRKRLVQDVRMFRGDVAAFAADYKEHGPMTPSLSPAEAQDRLRRFEDEFTIFNRKRELYVNGEDLFALPQTKYPELDAIARELTLAGKLYGLYKDVMARVEEWKHILWADVVSNIGSMTGDMDALASRCKKLPGKLRAWEAFDALNKRIEDFQAVLPLLAELSKPSLRERHWAALEKEVGMTLPVHDAEFKLEVLLSAGLVDRKDAVLELTDGADKELAIERKLMESVTRWQTAAFVFAPWKARGVHIIMGAGLILEELDEAQMNLQTMLTMRYVAFTRDAVASQLTVLSDTTETLELWQKVQTLWCSLESVFLGGDIAKQMPLVARRFQKLDKDFVNLMDRANATGLIVPACANDLLRLSLPGMYEELEKCQKSLEGYLEQKRNKFPRFYFVSNPVLLQILSQGSDPLAVQQYYEKIFDSISCVEHDPKEKALIRALISREGRAEERIALRKPVKTAGNIEDWLNDLLMEMQRTLKALAVECATEAALLVTDTSGMRRFVDASCGQYALLGLQLLWTADTEQALGAGKKDKNALKAAAARSHAVLTTLSSWCLTDLGSRMNRTKIETLVTVQVHMRDVSADLLALQKSKRMGGADDFEWLKQMRFYWDPDASDCVNEDGAMDVRVTDVGFQYQYEYLGCKERLVITPLTDRCYITLAQALGMFYGGAPAGPAGTGKTETVKDMGRSLGIYVVVTNCTDQQRCADLAKIFKGLCMAGLWGCFDEFNRITLPVLSVVAQQVLAILNAKKAGVDNFVFPGDTQQVAINAAYGAFITMNPGYAGRQELPENLKALFRGVAMMVPDREIIMKVKLCSVGYTDFQALAHKFFVCYQLCEEQLSKQKHYDFGLRNILSVLRTAGATKRENLDASEEMLLYRTLRDMNLSKLVAQDVPLFLSMLADLFPSIAAPTKREYPVVEAAIRAAVAEARLVAHPSWVNKIVQLYETMLVRHGIMVVGPAASGKSRIIETMQAALMSAESRSIRMTRLNPKAIQAHEMYGQTDPASGEWVKGVFASIWEKYNNRELPYTTWITADGPVDAIWIEDLNSVLDDNKLLTLASGDRIPMTDNVKILFEAESLANASPATVSRAGIIYVSDTDLDWKPVADAWLAARPAEQGAALRAGMTRVFGENSSTDPGVLFDMMARKLSPVIAMPRAALVANVLNLLGVLCDKYADVAANGGARVAAACDQLLAFSVAWGVGGVLETNDRAAIDAHLRTALGGAALPPVTDGSTIYEWQPMMGGGGLTWGRVRAPEWRYPDVEVLDYPNLLVPTMDSTRALSIVAHLHGVRRPVLLVGSAGTAKTTTALMFARTLDAGKHAFKRINFSSATLPGMFQESIDAELDKRGGKSFGPPGGKRMTIFIDDASMPTINTWGDQPTNELVRQLVESGGYYFLDRDRRGDFKTCEDLQFLAAMSHPGGGRNDVPARLKRHFFVLNLVPPAAASIDDLYGQMLRGRFSAGAGFSAGAVSTAGKLTTATIELWSAVRGRMFPTPTKFHYIWNLRELSRVFQGVLMTRREIVRTGGLQAPCSDDATNLLRLWQHECYRVFADKMVSEEDKSWFDARLGEVVAAHYGGAAAALLGYASPGAAAATSAALFVDFMRPDVYDEDDVMVEEAPKVYEPVPTLGGVRDRVVTFLAKYNEEFPARRLDLVLFDDALRHLTRIARVLAMPRGSALLVGVGGSGKQSLTRLAAYVARSRTYQITLTKSYGVNAFRDDLKILYRQAGHARKSTTFLFTDGEIKDEAFLEFINSILLTGDVAGLFAKDEMMAMTADLAPSFLRDRPGVPDSPDNLKQYFIDCVRDNLHVVLCMSPVNAKFAERARRFPGLIAGTTIDWFLPWPEEALVAVSRGLLSDFTMDADASVKAAVQQHMGAVHSSVVRVCEEYYASTRRHVYVTPRSFLSFLAQYKAVYTAKLAETVRKEANVTRGLEKLVKGAADVEALKGVLAVEEVKLHKATADTAALLASLQVQQADATVESARVAAIKASCESEATRISAEEAACAADLAKAQPIVDRAVRAVDSIKPADINEVKKLAKPADIIKVVFDGVIILFMKPLGPPVVTELTIKKRTFEAIAPSYDVAASIMGDTGFLKALQTFDKDGVNEETVELMKPYTDMDEFDPVVAKAASQAAEGLCTWTRAMGEYFYASRVVKPKLEALRLAQAQLVAANEALTAASAREAEVLATLARLKATFDAQMAEKLAIETNAAALQRKMEQASALIRGLDGERIRWTEDAAMFADVKRRLIGDCAVACGFLSYAGPFNAPFRASLIRNKFIADAVARRIPVTVDLDVIPFLADAGMIGDWNMAGLPTDPLSIQNGILVTRSSRSPLLVDPQGQALNWLRNTRGRDGSSPPPNVLPLSHPKLKDNVEFALSEGRVLIVVGVDEEIDPLLDPVLDRAYVTRGRRTYVRLADTEVEVVDGFALYFVTRQPNPHFSPELQAKTTVIDFTVTMKGLEEQLLGRVIAREQAALEKLLTAVLAELNANTKSLLDLDALLLERLSSNTGNLLDDETLIDVLANTKAKTAEVKEKLAAADETKRNISEKREQFRPVATRGSVLYFSIVEMSAVNVMYQTSLAQFIELFNKSMATAEKAALASKRVANIIDTMTYVVYRYVNRGLYERDKLLFVFLVAAKVLVTGSVLDAAEVALFLRGGAALDAATARKRPSWMPTPEPWLNALAVAAGVPYLDALPDAIMRNEGAWRRWFEDNEPEALDLPDYEATLREQKEVGPWRRLIIIRALRMDRTQLAVRTFLRSTPGMGERYVEPVTDTIESITDESTPGTPVVFLLSIGADPTEGIEQLAKKRKQVVACVSMGEGQEPVALKALSAAAVNGTWVLLQNCELGLELMDRMEEVLARMADTVHPDFRLFLTALPHPRFPLGLLQMSMKVTNEPPSGLRAGLLRSYQTLVEQDRLERIDTPTWRRILFIMCFLHSIVQERRKFGPLGWCIPYDYGAGDAAACLTFLERHMYSGNLSCSTVQYMIAEVQYGGKVTDNLDRRLFATYAQLWFTPRALDAGFAFNPATPLARIPGDFRYVVFDGADIDAARRYASSLPDLDSPEIFGLHPNADLTFRVKEATAMLDTLSETQPKQAAGGGGGGKSRDDIVLDKAGELLGKLREDFNEEETRVKIRRLGGLAEPLNMFLYQEIQRFQAVITRVRSSLTSMRAAIKGEVVMTAELQAAMADIADARVPRSWLYTPGGDELSWLMPWLGAWAASMQERDTQFRTWLNSARPSSFWMAGFSNPQGFLTAMKQEVTRMHRAQEWALDGVEYHSEVTDMDRAENVRAPPKEGVYVYGLQLEGARWDRSSAALAESEPKKLYASMPVLHITAVTQRLLAEKRAAMGHLADTPLYRYAMRTERYRVLTLGLPTRMPAEHWILRGAALLCMT